MLHVSNFLCVWAWFDAEALPLRELLCYLTSCPTERAVLFCPECEDLFYCVKVNKIPLSTEILGAFISVISIWIVTGALVYLAIERIVRNDYEIDGHVMLITSGCAVIVNIMWVVLSIMGVNTVHHVAIIKPQNELKAAHFLMILKFYLKTMFTSDPFTSKSCQYQTHYSTNQNAETGAGDQQNHTTKCQRSIILTTP